MAIKLEKTRFPGIFKRQGLTKTTYVATVRVGNRQRKHSFDTLAAAKAWRADRLREAGDGTYVEPSKKTVGDVLTEAIEAKRGEVEPNTIHSYYNKRKQLAALHDIPVQSLTLADAVRWRTAAFARKRPYAKSTVAGALGMLKGAMGYAKSMRLVSENPLADLKIEPAKASKENVLTPAELARLRALWNTQEYARYAVLLEFIVETGARVNEACVALQDDLDLDAGVWWMRRRRTKSDVGKPMTAAGAKSESGTRFIRLSPGLVALLRVHLTAMRDQQQFNAAFNPDGFLFRAPKGGPMRANTVNGVMNRLWATAGIHRITPHGLRHTSATEAVAAGISIKVVSERLGHKDPATTLRMYVHPNEDEHKAAVDVLAKRLKSG
jgi:integrase